MFSPFKSAGFVLATTLLIAGAAWAEQPGIMVLNVKAEMQAEPGLAVMLTDIVLQELYDLKQFRVIGEKEVGQMLNMEQKKQLAGCSDTGCLIQIAGAMGTRFMMTGTVGVVETSNMLSLVLIDVDRAEAVSRKTAIVSGNRSQLLSLISKLLSEVMVPALKELEKKKAKASDRPPKPAEQPAQVAVKEKKPETPMSPYVLAGHVTFWSGIVFLGLGVGSTVMVVRTADDARKDPANKSIKDKNAMWSSLAVSGYVIGGAAALTGAALWIYDAVKVRPPSPVSVSPVFTTDGAFVFIGGPF